MEPYSTEKLAEERIQSIKEIRILRIRIMRCNYENTVFNSP